MWIFSFIYRSLLLQWSWLRLKHKKKPLFRIRTAADAYHALTKWGNARGGVATGIERRTYAIQRLDSGAFHEYEG
jgi:hypothetical protein